MHYHASRIILATGLVLLTASSANAASGRVALAQIIAQRTWGTVCDGVPVTVRHGTLPPTVAARATYNYGNLGPDTASAFYNCRITISPGPISWNDFCTLYDHETGHLAGWRAAPGQAYMRQSADGSFRLDYTHSRNTRSLMYPVFIAVYRRCRGKQPAGVGSSFELSSLPTIALRLSISHNLLTHGWWNRTPTAITN